ncbi:rod shape-determining protein RodA [Rurimicrobium arvi]|uniref:Cell wall polymerase n=1 Tax=Rurimicrobium arvi TaxID=2049916 RepID=A0ABP8MWV8_9BACT
MSSNATSQKSVTSRIDAATFWLYMALVVIGIVAVFSVEYRSTDPTIFMMSKSHMKQTIWLGISLFVGMIIIFTDSKFFSSFAFLSYTVCLLLMIATIFIGQNMKGSHSWLSLGGGIRFQPGEIGKIFTSLALARFLSLGETDFRRTKDRFIGLAIALVPAMVIILQNETGLALVYFSFILVMYREGLPNAILITIFALGFLTISTLLLSHTVMLILILMLATGIGLLLRHSLRREGAARIVFIGSLLFALLFSQVMIPLAFKKVLKNYQIERIYTMLGRDVPDEYVKYDEESSGKKKDPGYNVRQSMIAIGSGGFWGKGYLNGTSTKNSFVPEQNTDFIFCSIGEQFGFLGSFVVIGLYILLMLRILTVAERQKSPFSRIYGYCVASVLFFHFAINISMTIGLAPVIGITLPFISYGGTSLLSFSILIFILLKLDTDRSLMIH